MKKPEILTNIFSEVLSQFAFMFTDSQGEQNYPEDGSYLASISFYGEHKGDVELIAPKLFANELAENVLGIDSEEVTEQIAGDAMKELLNIICGEIISVIYGTKAIYDLTPPKIKELNNTEWKKAWEDNIKYAKLWVDESPIILTYNAEV